MERGRKGCGERSEGGRGRRRREGGREEEIERI